MVELGSMVIDIHSINYKIDIYCSFFMENLNNLSYSLF